jgi:hypothetical protein
MLFLVCNLTSLLPPCSRCFLLTPKLLPDLEYSPECTVLNIMNGPWLGDTAKSEYPSKGDSKFVPCMLVGVMARCSSVGSGICCLTDCRFSDRRVFHCMLVESLAEHVCVGQMRVSLIPEKRVARSIHRGVSGI